MTLASRTRMVRLTKWFPAHDSLAAKIARLCVLREDFHLEMNGVFEETVKELDGLSEEWRRLYFVRNLIRTLREIESGIQTLFSDPEFKRLLANQDQQRKRESSRNMQEPWRREFRYSRKYETTCVVTFFNRPYRKLSMIYRVATSSVSWRSVPR